MAGCLPIGVHEDIPVLSRALSAHDREAQEARKAEVEQRILDAVAALLTEGRPFAEVSVAEIAGRAQLSRSAFYKYFRDKQALVLRLTEIVTGRMVTEAQGWGSAGLQLPGDLPRVLRSIARLFADDAPVLRAITEAAYYDEAMSKRWHDHLSLIISALQARLETEQARGRLGGLRPDVTACALVWMVQQTCYQELIASSRFTPDDLVDVLDILIERALLLSPAAVAERVVGQRSDTSA